METQSIAAMALNLQTTEIPVTTADELPRPSGRSITAQRLTFVLKRPSTRSKSATPTGGEFICPD